MKTKNKIIAVILCLIVLIPCFLITTSASSSYAYYTYDTMTNDQKQAIYDYINQCKSNYDGIGNYYVLIRQVDCYKLLLFKNQSDMVQGTNNENFYCYTNFITVSSYNMLTWLDRYLQNSANNQYAYDADLEDAFHNQYNKAILASNFDISFKNGGTSTSSTPMVFTKVPLIFPTAPKLPWTQQVKTEQVSQVWTKNIGIVPYLVVLATALIAFSKGWNLIITSLKQQ